MKVIRSIAWGIVGASISLVGVSQSFAQVVINEVVKEERTAGAGAVAIDTREFIELYNAGATSVDISGWSIVRWDYAADGPGMANITLPGGSTIAPGDYFVIGGSAASLASVRDYQPGAGTDLFPDLLAYALELRNSSSVMVDAVAYDVHRTGIFPPTAEQAAQIGSGYHGQLQSYNHPEPGPVARASWSRYRNGVDTNSNGRDFGILQQTPGASNNLPLLDSHAVPDVDALTNGTTLSTQYHASFVLPRVITPGTVDVANPRVIPASPQGGKAIAAWDNTGGGNVSYSKELVNSFDLMAYFDTTPLGIAATTNDEEWETVSYGIGSADGLYGTPDSTGAIFIDGVKTGNASTGIGWVYQQYENGGVPDTEPSFNKLMLVDFGDGGDSVPGSAQWNVIETIDMSAVAAGWYRLGIDYDPATGDVVATFGDETYEFTTAEELLGTFFVGYREGITAEQERLALLNPPIYDLIEEAGTPGDYNDDGLVDAADYVMWRKGIAPLANDATAGNQPGDYGVWEDHFGEPAPGSSNGAVPEPSSIALVMLAIVGLAVNRRGRG
jgi:hypothetical protein